MGIPKRSNHDKNQSAILLPSPALLQQKVKVFNKVIRPGIEYTFYATPFSIPDIHKTVKLLIKLTKSLCNLTNSTPNIFTQLPCNAFGIETFSLLPKYTTTLSEQLTQTLNDLGPLGQIY